MAERVTVIDRATSRVVAEYDKFGNQPEVSDGFDRYEMRTVPLDEAGQPIPPAPEPDPEPPEEEMACRSCGAVVPLWMLGPGCCPVCCEHCGQPQMLKTVRS